MKRIFFAYAWILLSTGVIFTSIAAFHLYALKENQTIQQKTSQAEVNAAEDPEPYLNPEVKGIETDARLADARAVLVSNFLERHSSPLQPYDYFGQFLVDLADKNDFDFRLLPAIAMQESNLCKSIPAGSYNCLGFGIHSRGTLTFENFEANFERAAKELKMYYIDEGLTTPELIMTKYTPGSDGSWAESVKQWMSEMKYDDYGKGKSLKEDNPSVLEYASGQTATTSGEATTEAAP